MVVVTLRSFPNKIENQRMGPVQGKPLFCKSNGFYASMSYHTFSLFDI